MHAHDMRFATPDGYKEVRTRAWPLSGLGAVAWHNGSAEIRLASLPGGGLNSATYESIYRMNPWVYTAVTTLARDVSAARAKVFRYDSEGRREWVRSDLPDSIGQRTVGQALDHVLRMPEPRVGFRRWVRKIQTDRGIFGNALAIIERNTSTGAPVALWHVPWRLVTVQQGETVPVLWYEVGGGIFGERKRFAPEEVIHFVRGIDTDGPIGLSPLKPLHATLALHDALMRHAVAYFENAARPSGNLQLDRNTSIDVIEKVREQVTALYTAPENAGKILVTSGEWQSMSDAPDQSQLIDLARLSREEIAAAYGIPQPVLGILDRAIMNNTRELRNLFTRDVVGGETEDLEDDLMAQLVNPNPAAVGHFIEFDLSASLRPDTEAIAEISERTRHVLTPNEQREKFFGMNPIEQAGADSLWMPSGQVEIGAASEPEGDDA